MNQVKIIALLFLILILGAAGFGLFLWFGRVTEKNQPQALTAVVDELPLIELQPLFYQKENFTAAVLAAQNFKSQADISAVVVPHHLLASGHIARVLKTASGRPIKTVVILGPNHENIGPAFISSAAVKWQTPNGSVTTDQSLVNQFLSDFRLSPNPEAFVQEHALGAIVPFVEYYFPQAKVLPIIFNASASNLEAQKVAAWLKKNLTPESLVVGSLDFSHYLNKAQADQKDEVTKQLILAGEFEKVVKLDNTANVDSPAALAAILRYAKNLGLKPEILAHTNSFDLSWEKPVQTTSHFAIVFSPTPAAPEITLAFGGDVMLSRQVNQKMIEFNDFTWPFKNIGPFLAGADLAVINLESPFLRQGDFKVPTGSFLFKTDPQAMAGLKFAGIDLVSLANNHFSNQGQKGMAETFSLLTENGISYIGAGENLVQAHQGRIFPLKGVKFGFLAYAYPSTDNATNNVAGIAGMDIESMITDIVELKKQVDVVIVIMHAGEEYVSQPNQQQKEFAQAAIKSGADLVLGHHPHWVQTVEIYQDKPIIYSLGNLVFDQMWSQPTREGVILKVNFKNTSLNQLEFIPIQINNYGQPEIISDPKQQLTIWQRMGLSGQDLDF